VQNQTKQPQNQTFTITGGVMNFNVRSGARGVDLT